MRVLLVLLLLAPASVRAQEVIGLGRLGLGTYSSATAISADGSTVVGYSENSDAARHAIRWTQAGGLEDLGDLPAGSDDSVATGVSADGSVIVGAGSAGSSPGSLDGGAKAFRWTAAAGMQQFVASFLLSAANGVSADGTTAVGFRGTSLAVQLPTAWRPDGLGGFVIDELEELEGGLEEGVALDASSDGGVVVGYSSSTASGSAFEAVRWNGSAATPLGDLPGGAFASEARAVSADGLVIVGSGFTAAGREAFRWTEATGLVSLGDLAGGGVDSVALATSADGSVVVGFATPDVGVRHAFVWDAVDGMRDLNEIADAAAQDWLLEFASGVSGNGSVIVGEGTAPDGNPEAWRLRVPEPHPLAASLAGVAGLWTARRTRAARRTRR
ncbi:MAG: PEP-CTERM sorting domain-containing protein [Myxococcota bacterium]|jgi:probable HAF family extracellular repeat protein|nr:PEP-CTERM sorting domain-containing protein [Myxococcota bacterium]